MCRHSMYFSMQWGYGNTVSFASVHFNILFQLADIRKHTCHLRIDSFSDWVVVNVEVRIETKK